MFLLRHNSSTEDLKFASFLIFAYVYCLAHVRLIRRKILSYLWIKTY